MNELINNIPFFELSFVVVIVCFLTLINFAIKYDKLATTLSKKLSIPVQELKIYLYRFVTFIITGVIPAILFFLLFDISLADIWIKLPENRWYFWLLGGLVMNGSMLIVRYISPKLFPGYPEVETKVWTKKRFFLNGTAWFFFLVGYEVLFRGFLFYVLLTYLGLIPALLISSGMYGLAHLNISMEEAFNCTYFHALLCLSIYYTNSMLIAFVVHLFVAIMNDYLAIKKDPKLSLVK